MKKLIIILFIIPIFFFAQEKKDTLFFNFDKEYFKINAEEPDIYYLEDSSNDGSFIFLNPEIYYCLNPNIILNLKYFIRSSKFYRKDLFRKLNDSGLSIYFKKYIIFLVKEKEFIKVDASTVYE
jgi:hypothetical protein